MNVEDLPRQRGEKRMQKRMQTWDPVQLRKTLDIGQKAADAAAPPVKIDCGAVLKAAFPEALFAPDGAGQDIGRGNPHQTHEIEIEQARVARVEVLLEKARAKLQRAQDKAMGDGAPGSSRDHGA